MRPEDVPAALAAAGREALYRHLRAMPFTRLPTYEERARAVLAAALPVYESQLLAERDQVRQDYDYFVRAVRSQRRLHRQYRFAGDDTTDYCGYCNLLTDGWVPWPCPPSQILDTLLSGIELP